jgi:serine/threonine protein phosphatase PrpC
VKAAITRFALAASEKHGTQDACEAVLLPDAVIAVIADGAGQAEGAREAATKAVASITANFKARPRTWSVARALDEFARLINRTLHQESLARFEQPELVCTLGVVAIEGNQVIGLNVGDSRVYHCRGDRLTRLSVDHIEETPDLRHVLQRAIGLAVNVSPHAFEHPVSNGDLLLLCTDGVTNLLPDPELAALLARRVSARTLVMTARERATAETLDDMTAIVVEITEIDPPRASGLPLEIPEVLQAGQTFDGFTLVRPFNANERTWMAERAGKPAVVKFAPVQARAGEAIRNQFLKESWSLARLKADFFTNAFVPEDGRVLCYGMDYIEAPTLKDHLRAGPLSVDDARALAAFLLNACQFLLRFDLVHGDLKPENILVLPTAGSAQFKLIDFGSISEIFSVNSRAGTPSYLAPERFHGAPLSERTELVAIGVVLHESLTRQFPYGEIEPFQTPTFRPPRKPSQFNPNIPPWLDAIVLRAIAADPEARYQSYSEMKFDLENPTRVKPWFQPDAPLLERNPVLFYKTGFFVLLALNLYLLFRLLLK